PGGRPSLSQQAANTASSPNLNLAASAAFARKASLNALTAAGQNGTGANNQSPSGKMVGGDGRELDLGETVDVPGGMHGVIKFIGSVKGKKGTFAGVELSSEFAAKGKNDGDVDGYARSPVAQQMQPICHIATLRRRGHCLRHDLIIV
ncbi:MAG: hypothetical protein INR71_09295, partial [Terriglobus roseus]|nr:hypothetical protein [Terriglobus roseus]